MQTNPQVSLLIPTYNNEKTVAASIESCLAQTFSDLEIIVYDEASKDHTREIIQQAAALDPRIRILVSEQNSGPVRAWRKLLHEARGKWCTFVWSDDLLMPGYVETLVEILKANPTHLITGCSGYTEQLSDAPAQPGASPPVRKRVYEFETVRLKGDEYALGIMAGIFPVTQMCNLFDTVTAREVFDHYIEFANPYGFDFSRRAYGNDVSFLSELALRSGEVVEVGEPLVVLRDSPKSMTVVALRDHPWQFRLQYVWAIRSAWTRCRELSPRMDALIRVADERVHLCDTIYSLQQRKWPRECNLIKIIRAIFFLLTNDRRVRQRVSPKTIQTWLAKR